MAWYYGRYWKVSTPTIGWWFDTPRISLAYYMFGLFYLLLKKKKKKKKYKPG